MIHHRHLLYPPGTDILAKCHDAILAKCSSGTLILVDLRFMLEIRMTSPTYSSGLFMLNEKGYRNFRALRQNSKKIIGFCLGEPARFIAMLSDEVVQLPPSACIFATPTLLKTRDKPDTTWQKMLWYLSD